MKKIFLLILAFVCTTGLYAQSSKDIKYGFRLGANYATLSGDDNLEDLNSRIGLHANFFADIALGTGFSIQPELGVSALGANEEEIRLDNGDYVQFKTNWLQLAILANIDLNNRFYILAGPLVGANVTERDDNDYYNYDFAAVLGLGYNFDENISLDLRYGYGLSNVFDREFADLEEANNRWIQIGISYKL